MDEPEELGDMGTYTLPLSEVGERDRDLSGGKAVGLAALVGKGFTVPDGFVVTTAAFRDFVGAADMDGDAPVRRRRVLAEAAIPTEIEKPVRMAYRELGSPPVAVRSSAIAEDMPGASFAGQYETVLNVSGEDELLAGMRTCWASLWSPHAVDYRARNHLPEERLAMAVVVQRMVNAEWSGVMFTSDPVNGRRDRILIEAVPGLGEDLVSGRVAATSHRVAKDSGEPVGAESRLPAALRDELVRVGYDIDRAFGCPQDVEWAYADGHLAFVQTRSLTGLPGETPPEQSPTPPAERKGRLARKLDRASLLAAEHAPVPPYPMDGSLLIGPAVRAIIAALRSAGLSTSDADQVLTGRDDGIVRIVPPEVRPSARMVVRLPLVLPKALWLVLTGQPARWLSRCERTQVSLAHELDEARLDDLTDDRLVAEMERLRRAAGPLVPRRFACFPRGRLADRLLRGVLRHQVGAERAPDVYADLMTAIPSITWDANQELHRLAASIHASPTLRAIYAEEEPAEIPERLRGLEEGRGLLQDVDAYLRRFGYWKNSTPSVGIPPLRETPVAVHGQLKPMSAAPRTVADDRFSRAHEAISSADGVRGRLLRPFARRLARTARTFHSFREDSHYHIFTVFAVTRRYVLELGRRLVERGLLDTPDDIVYLEMGEVRSLPAGELRDTVERRRPAREKVMAEYRSIPATLAEHSNYPGFVRGTPASRGRAVGQVRLIRGEDEFGKLRAGDILVCPFTSPSWTPLFSRAAGVVGDAGGAVSHSAVVAREYGIPAVMATGNATRVLADGQWVEVDGAEGTVMVVNLPT